MKKATVHIPFEEEKLAAVMKALDAVLAKLGVPLTGRLEEVYRRSLK